MHEPPVPDEDAGGDVSMSTFVAFVDVEEGRKRAFVASLDDDYSPPRDYYRQMREAIRSGRRMSNDRRAMESVLACCPPEKKDNYAELAWGWLHFAESCSNDTLVDIRTGRWRGPSIGVRVTPDLAVRRPDGSYAAIRLHLRGDAPSPREVFATLWLMRRALPHLLPGARSVLLDVRRAKVYDTLPDIEGFERRLEAEAARLAALRAEFAA